MDLGFAFCYFPSEEEEEEGGSRREDRRREMKPNDCERTALLKEKGERGES